MKTPSRDILYRVIFVFFVCLLAVVPAMDAWATFISPKRVMIEDKQRSARLTIHNGTDQTLVYRFEWEHRAQVAGGNVLLMKEGETVAGYRPAESMLRFSPRQVILKPNEHQRIRFLVQRPADMAEGEYHSHFLIKSEPMEEATPAPPPVVNPKTGIIGSLKVRTNASIPVFLRHGKTQVDFTLNSARLIQEDGLYYVRVQLNNNSTRSLYIKPELVCGSGDNATSTIIRTIKLYTEGKSVNDDIPVPKAFDLSGCSSLQLKLSGTDDFEHKRKVITQIDVAR
ncbi:MAG: hypothetical protein DHS20C02_12940 [Micavibrio sp.]|nr:MAG: hypothetical protein DHS20C02_12940 [Micavibrio sp.]